MNMGWYSARLIFETEIEGPPDPNPLREESIRVLVADTEELAWKRAEEIGLKSEHTYKNDANELVSWRFRGVAEIQDLCEEELKDGAEVYSRLSTVADDGH